MAKKRKSWFEAVKQQYVVTYNRIKESNVDGIPDVMKTHDHEQAGTFLILLCFNITRRDPFTKCTVFAWHRCILTFNTFLPISSPIFTVSHWKGKTRKKYRHRITLWRYWIKSCPSLVRISCFYWLQPDGELPKEVKTILVEKISKSIIIIYF